MDLSNQVISARGGALVAQQLYGSDQRAFGAAVANAVDSIIDSRSIGPGNSEQFAGISGSSAVTISDINTAQSRVQNMVAEQLNGTPANANATPTQIFGDTSVTGGGKCPLDKPQGNPFSSAPPQMPGSMSSPNGESVTATGVQESNSSRAESIRIEVSTVQANTNRKATDP
jgi:hypothetical protein